LNTSHLSRGFELNLKALAMIYRSPKYMVLTIASAALYYLLFNYFVSLDNHGIVIYSEPVYLVYSLAITAAVLLTITVYSLTLRLRRRAQASSSAGLLASISTVVGGCITGCACQAPILYNLLYFVGLNAFEASGIVSTLLAYDFDINVALIALNLLVAYRLLSKVSRVGGSG
jgi:hypothetical protein